MKCIKKTEQELNWVKTTRNHIARMMACVTDANVLIGGSYGLKYQCDSFENREVTDYDFIVRVNKSDFNKVHEFFFSLLLLGVVEHGYSGNEAYKFKKLEYQGRHAECLIVPCGEDASIHSVRVYGRIWEKPTNIIKAKEEYIEEYKKKGLEPRKKDVDDVQNYYAHEDLPF